MLLLLRIAPVLLLLLVSVSSARADCWPTTMQCKLSHEADVIETSLATTGSFDCDGFQVQAHLSFDILAGRLSAQALSVPIHWVSVRNDDDYLVTGPPAGTALTITAVADLELTHIRVPDISPTYVWAIIWVPDIAGAPIPNWVEEYFMASAPGTETVTRQMRFDLPVKVGQPFKLILTIGVESEEGGGGTSIAVLRFEGLPPGSTITSCKGYQQDLPTPVIARTWGGLKATYR